MSDEFYTRISIDKLHKEEQCRPDLRKSLERFKERGRKSDEKLKSFQEVLENEMKKGEEKD